MDSPARNDRSKTNSPEGIIYLGHIPFGFFEHEIKKFFSQFGQIKAICLKRSKKTGNSKGYAFIQFKVKEVAEIAAQSINNYILLGKSLVCKVVDKDKAHPNMLKRVSKRSPTSTPTPTISKAGVVLKQDMKVKLPKKMFEKEKNFKDIGYSISDTLCFDHD